MKLNRQTIMGAVGLLAGAGAGIITAGLLKKATPDDLNLYKRVAVAAASGTIGMAASAYVNQLAQKQTSDTIDQVIVIKEMLTSTLATDTKKAI